ncbi:hypothetical protein AC578_7457 [Pseudocercospora eumusae]|uniref:Ketoreductase (KR) domain-containing protein n=1 Tax=Pseudocercospora eumusae TaxID=321146 RepID=A0A139H8Z0_9PEZI|nr:hypothetical protein AC578_7457 [Pseudocercospora eumusae]
MPGSKNTYDPKTDMPDISGKVYVVTGGSAGIGFGICAHLLQHNCAALYILSKKKEHLEEAQQGLKKYGDISKLHPIQLDLEDLHQTDKIAARLSKELIRLDALILHASLSVAPSAESKDSIDTHMQVNILSQHHLTMCLLPLLIQTHDSRLVLQTSSSSLHHFSPSPKFPKEISELKSDIIGPMTSPYGRTKLSQILQTRALVRRKQRAEIGMRPNSAPWINTTHPGEQAIDAHGNIGVITRPSMKDAIDQGCRSALFAATSPDVAAEKMDGEYIVSSDCRVSSETTEHVQDEELGERLWELTEQILREKLGGLPYRTS